MYLHRLFPLLLLVSLLLPQSVLAAEAARPPIVLRLSSLQNNRHVYYVALLEQSLKALGYPVKIELLPPIPPLRLWSDVKVGHVTLVWGVQTTERDQELIGVDNRLTNGLIGMRVLMVPKASEEAYAKVHSLEDLRVLNKVGGAGEGWFDVELWQLNSLPLVVRKGDWNHLFRMVAAGDRGVDYIIRGAHEAMTDLQANPELVVEPHLLLTHERDMRFYLGPSNAALGPILEKALAQADRSGLKKRLVAEYLWPALNGLKIESRQRLALKTPSP